VDFQADIQPIFENHAGTATAPAQMGQLRLDSEAAAMAGGQSGKVIVPAALAIVSFISVSPAQRSSAHAHGRQAFHGPDRKIRTWIDQGAATSSEAPTKKHWAFIAPVRPRTPTVKQAKWVSNPIDAFILERLETENSRPRLRPIALRFSAVSASISSACPGA